VSIEGNATWIGDFGTPITGTGTVNVVSGAKLTIPSGTAVTLGRPMTNDGTITVNNSTFGLIFGSSGSLTNETDGVIKLTGASPVINEGSGAGLAFTNSGTLDSSATGTATIAVSITNQPLGKLDVSPGNLSLTNGAFPNSGSVMIGDGSAPSTLTVANQYQQLAGSTTIAIGSTLTTTSSDVALSGGVLEGAGTVTSSVLSSGTGVVENASLAGPLLLSDGYSGSGGVQAAITSVTVFDKISVTGTATLSSSNLALSTNPSFAPANGQTFTILTCSVSCSGPFASITGTAIPTGGSYQVSYTGTSVVLTVTGRTALSPTITSAAPPPARRASR
jgi:hypothetical protein